MLELSAMEVTNNRTGDVMMLPELLSKIPGDENLNMADDMESNRVTVNLLPVGTETSDPMLYKLTLPQAIRLRDLFMHRNDLQLMNTWLGELLSRYSQGVSTSPTALDEALWTASVVAFFRCFTPSARGHLDAKKVFANEPLGALEAYERLHAFRNRTIVHDESYFNQGLVGVPVATPEGPVARVGPVQLILLRGISFDFEEISNLFNLGNAAIGWIDSESIRLNELLDEKIKSMSRAEIVEHGPIYWTSPSFDAADKQRPRV